MHKRQLKLLWCAGLVLGIGFVRVLSSLEAQSGVAGRLREDIWAGVALGLGLGWGIVAGMNLLIGLSQVVITGKIAPQCKKMVKEYEETRLATAPPEAIEAHTHAASLAPGANGNQSPDGENGVAGRQSTVQYCLGQRNVNKGEAVGADGRVAENEEVTAAADADATPADAPAANGAPSIIAAADSRNAAIKNIQAHADTLRGATSTKAANRPAAAVESGEESAGAGESNSGATSNATSLEKFAAPLPAGASGTVVGILIGTAIGVFTTLVAPAIANCGAFTRFVTWSTGIDVASPPAFTDFVGRAFLGLCLGLGLLLVAAAVNWAVEQSDATIGE